MLLQCLDQRVSAFVHTEQVGRRTVASSQRRYRKGPRVFGAAGPIDPQERYRGSATLSRALRVRTSTLDRDLSLRTLAGTGELEKPRTWTADWVKHRMVEAFTIERRIPDKRVGPAMVRNTWKLDTTDTFAERVGQGELARENVWEAWARAGGALPHEVSRMEEALS